MAKLSLFIIFFTVTYIKQRYIRKVILFFCRNNASANVPQHYVPPTYYVPFISKKRSLKSERR